MKKAFSNIYFLSFMMILLAGNFHCEPTFPNPTAPPAASFSPQDEKACRADVSGTFAYYMLALSWSPEWCRTHPDKASEEMQCEQKRNFVVHGLWPQCREGYPEKCASSASTQLTISREQIYRFMPSDFLITHEWEKHGVCSGLGKSDYFLLIGRLFNKIRLPDLAKLTDPASPEQIEQAFIDANPGLITQNIALNCRAGGDPEFRDNTSLDEVYICFGRNEHPTPCNVTDSCAGLKKVRITQSP